jgi:hypothetical protein
MPKVPTIKNLAQSQTFTAIPGRGLNGFGRPVSNAPAILNPAAAVPNRTPRPVKK